MVGGEISTCQIGDRSKLQAQGLRVELVAAHNSRFHQSQRINSSKGGLIKAAMTMHNHGSAQPQPGQSLSHRIEQIRPGHPEHLGLGPQGIYQWAQQIENSPHPQAAAQGGKPHQSRMPTRGEQKSHSRTR